ncbi:MAG: hypothetical protein HS106_10490 [Ideonella sp.]|nr:MAG: hypothetical protein F9K36_11190 [Burkholderiaceae bacterium]MBE7426459.1 hypothetical protein [Ideonella sp.]
MSGSEYDEGHRRGLQESSYSGSGSHADWAGWQQGNAQKQRNEEQLRESMMPQAGKRAPDYSGPVAPGGGGGLGNFVVLAVVGGVVLLLPFLLLALVVGVVSAVTALWTAPLLPAVARITGGTDRSDGFKARYVLMLGCLLAYGLMFFGLFAAFAWLGNVASHSWTSDFARVFGAMIDTYPVGYVSGRAIVWTMAVLQLPAMAAFSYVMRRFGDVYARDTRGFGRGMVAGFLMAGIGGGGTAIVLYSLVRAL